MCPMEQGAALVIPAIQTALTIVGATAGTMVGFVLPGLVYLQVGDGMEGEVGCDG